MSEDVRFRPAVKGRARCATDHSTVEGRVEIPSRRGGLRRRSIRRSVSDRSAACSIGGQVEGTISVQPSVTLSAGVDAAGVDPGNRNAVQANVELQ